MISFLDWKSVFMWSWIHNKARFRFLLMRKQEIRLYMYIFIYICACSSEKIRFLNQVESLILWISICLFVISLFPASLGLDFLKFVRMVCIKIEFYQISSVLFVVSGAGRWTHPDASSVHPDTPSQHPDTLVTTASLVGDFFLDFVFKPFWFVV